MYFKRKELEKFRYFKGPLIDVRSPSEYYKGHMPNSINIPLFCLLYTSDAADERSSVDLGGRRIIKKKSTSVF